MVDYKVKILNSTDSLLLGLDAKIVAIRWDLIPWGIVLDCDFPTEEDVENPPICRAWMIFDGIHELSLPLESARLPNGIISNLPLTKVESSDGFCNYELSLLLPQFSSTDKLRTNPHRTLLIRAKSFLGAVSVSASHYGEYGPSREQRNSLASDEEFLQAIAAVQKEN